MQVGDAMAVKWSVKGALAGSHGTVVAIEQIRGGSLLVQCRIIKDDTDATLWWLSRDEIVLDGSKGG